MFRSSLLFLAFAILAITVLLPAELKAQGSVPPARTFFTDETGKQTGVKERWGLDAGGERNGMYMKFNQNGLVVESATFVHGVQTGPGVVYNNLVANFSNPFNKRPDTKYTGAYRAGKKVGTWEGYDDATHEHRVTVVFDANGNEQLVTYYQKGKPVRVINNQQQRAQANARPATPVKAADFYTYSAAQKAQFEKMVFNYGTRTATGAELAAGNALKSLEFCDLLKDNNDLEPMSLLLKASKSLGANPTKLVITNASLTNDQLRPLLVLRSPQLDGELLYYGLRGSDETEKGHGTNIIVQRLIQARGTEGEGYKNELQASFYATAKAAKDTYSDTKTYTLRRWLYDEYKDSDPVKWMNKLTASDPQNDQKLYPGL